MLAVKAMDAGKLTSSFNVSAREPDSSDEDNHLSLTSAVIGSADLALTADALSIQSGETGKLTLTLKNNGPDPASSVRVNATVGNGSVSLQSASASQGSCGITGAALACKLGQVDAGSTVTVTLTLFGASTGSTVVNAQASTTSDDPNPANSDVTVKVTVAASPRNSGSGGSGALGWIVLAALIGLAGVAGYARRRRRPMW